jgi:hypothetical protein
MDNIVLALLVILLALIITYSIVVGYFEGTTSLKYNSDMNQSSGPINVSKSDAFSYGMWINANKLGSYKNSEGIYVPTNTTDVIIDRPGEIKLYVDNGVLKMTRGRNTYEIMSNFPSQKWIHITITLENSTKRRSFLNAYIDGKLIKSYQTLYSAGPNNTLTIGRFDAKLFGLKRWKYPLNTKMVLNEYEATNITKMLGNYNLDVSVLEDEKLSKRFTVF